MLGTTIDTLFRAADRAPKFLSRVIYLDVFVPQNGSCFFSIIGPDLDHQIREAARIHGEGWWVPPMWKAESFGVSDPGQARWVNSMATPESLRTFEESLSLNQTSIVLSSYIFCSGEPTGVFYRPFVERAINRGWNSAELPKAHFPMVTMPETLADLLIEVGEARD